MKKITALLLMLALAIGILAGCGDPKPPAGGEDGPTVPDAPTVPDDPHRPDGGDSSLIDKIPDGMTGEDVAKLLLAGERLGDKLIDGDEIFASGSETFRHLAKVAKENGKMTVTPAKSTFLDSERDREVQITQDGEVYTEFDLFSRNYVEFASTTESIVSEADRAADTIDYVKKHIRLLDVWTVSTMVADTRYFLHVDENSETIITDFMDGYSVCRRYKNAEGEDVYETYRHVNNGFAIRATYIKDKKYEFVTYTANHGERYQGISANKDKGYWEIIDFISDTSWVENQFGINFIVMKDDICYNTGYDNLAGKIGSYKLTTADRSCDIISVQEFEGHQVAFVLNLAAFTGYEKAVNTGGGIADLYLSNGSILNHDTGKNLGGDNFEAWINGVTVSSGAFGREGQIMLNISSDSIGECREILLSLLDGWGLKCKYDMSKVYNSIDRAALESANAIKYITFNGHRINDNAGLLAAIDVERELFASLRAEYEKVKNAEEINISDEGYELRIRFADTNVTSVGVSYANGVVTISNVGVIISDTMLMVKDEPYHVAIALKSLEDGSLIHLTSETEGTPYGGGESFSVTAENLTVELPALDAGSYQLVAYLATSEGIRSSGVDAVPILSADDSVIRIGNIEISGTVEDGALRLSYTENADVYVTLHADASIGYAELYDLIAATAYSYGQPENTVIEMLSDSELYLPLTGSETEMQGGTYRLAYNVQNGDRSISGYVYVTFTVSVG